MTGSVVSVPSKSREGVTYRVLVGLDGAASCTCPGYEYRQSCWHLDYAKEQLMSDEHALVPIKVEPPKAILPTRDELDVIGLIARSVMGARGHAVPQQIDSPAKAAAVMLAGHELGLKPMTALRHIYVVNGKTEPSAQVMAGVVQAREPDARIEVVELTDEQCTVRLVRPSRDINVEYTYEYADAERAGLTKPSRSGQPSNWVLYPKDMMRWAAVKRLCRTYASDLINSVGAFEVAAVDGLIEGVAEGAPSTYIEASATVPQEALYNEGDDAPAAGSEESQGAEDAPTSSDDIAEGDFAETDGDAPSTEAQDEPQDAADDPFATLPDSSDADATLPQITSAQKWLAGVARGRKTEPEQVCRALGYFGPFGHAVMAIAADLDAAKERWESVEAWASEHPDKSLDDLIAALRKRAAQPVEV